MRTIRAWWERRRAARRLRRLDLFGECSPAQLRAVDALLTEVAVPAGRTLMRRGARGLDFVIVLEGEATVRRGGRRLGTVEPGSFFGELALLDDTPRTATVVATTPMRVYVLNPFEFERLLDVAPSVKARVLDAARRRTRHLAGLRAA